MMDSTNKGIIYQGTSIISIEILPDYAQPVVIKKPARRHTSRPSLRTLENEYEMTRTLNAVEGVRKALGQGSIDNQPALVLEYIDGETLRNKIAGKTLDLRSRLEIAVALARVLGRIHHAEDGGCIRRGSQASREVRRKGRLRGPGEGSQRIQEVGRIIIPPLVLVITSWASASAVSMIRPVIGPPRI